MSELKKVQVTIAEIVQMVGRTDDNIGVLQIANKGLNLQERMSIAEIVRRLKIVRNNYQTSIERIDMSAFVEAKEAAREKYLKNKEKDADAMDDYLREYAKIEAKHAEKLAKHREISEQADKDAQQLTEVTIIPISQSLIEKMTLNPGELEIIYPLIAQ